MMRVFRNLLVLGVVGITAFAGTPALAKRLMLINGAGATFPYPIYSKWFSEYAKQDGTVNFNYQSIGSGGGIRQLLAGTVDFGASDAPMKAAEMKKAKSTVLHFPAVIGGVVATYNLPGSPKLNLSQKALADIFLGKIIRWNDPEIAIANQDLSLPDQPIIVIHRSDGSGTTFVFSDFLSNVSSAWKSKVGTGKSLKWPVGLGGKGNEGVAGLVKQIPNSIGYVELGYAKHNNLGFARVQNREGQFVDCTAQTMSNAAAGASSTMPDDFRVSIVNTPGELSYPISSFTWLLVYEQQDNREKAEALIRFIRWALSDGQNYTEALGYAPLPRAVIEMEKRALDRIQI